MLWMLTGISDDGCYGKVLNCCFAEEERVCRKEGVGDGGLNEGDESSFTRIVRAVLTDNGVVEERVNGEDDRALQFGFLYTGNQNIRCVKEG